MSDFALFAELMFPNLISLLSNSAKVMASSAEVCVKIIIKVSVWVVCAWGCVCIHCAPLMIPMFTPRTVFPQLSSAQLSLFRWNKLKVTCH